MTARGPRAAAASLALAAALGLGACTSTTRNYKTGTQVRLDRTFGARSKPAEVTRLTEPELQKKGYLRIGTLTKVDPPGKGQPDAETLRRDAEKLRREAAEKGADLVWQDQGLLESSESQKKCIPESFRKHDGTTGWKCSGGGTITSRRVYLPMTSLVLWRHEPAEVARAAAAVEAKERGLRALASAIDDPARLDALLASEDGRALPREDLEQAFGKGLATLKKGSVAVLLKRGIDPAGTRWGWPWLNRAILAGNAGAVEAFLDAGQAPLARLPAGSCAAAGIKHVAGNCPDTPAMAAAASGSVAVIELLSRRGVDFSKDVDALRIAAALDHGPAAARIAALARPSATAIGEALYTATGNGCRKAAAALIAAGAAVDYARSYNGFTVLQNAVYARDPEMVKLLLSKGADPNRRNTSTTPVLCCTALEIARRKDSPELVALLEKAGAR